MILTTLVCQTKFASHSRTGQYYAIKMLRKSDIIKYRQVEHIVSEKEILSIISKDEHPFIVHMAATFQDPSYICECWYCCCFSLQGMNEFA
jgi:serine/threonine protein kinase